jgi:hypothetical protein
VSAIDLAVLGRLYVDGADAKFSHHRVEHDEFRKLCVVMGHLQRHLRDSGAGSDTYWTLLMRTAKWFRFDAMASPVPFRDIELHSPISSLRSQYARCGSMYPQLAPVVVEVIDLLHLLSQSEDSPLLDAATDVHGTSKQTWAAVLCEARLVAASQAALTRVPRLKTVPVINQRQLRHVVWYEGLLLFGAPSWYGEHVFQAPRARAIEIFRFSWVSGKSPPMSSFTAPLGGRGAKSGDVGQDVAADLLIGDDHLEPAWVADLSFADIARQADTEPDDEGTREAVRARPFVMEGGRVVFLEADEDATALVLDLDEHVEDRLQRLPVDDIAEGMYLLLRAAGGGDYVVPVADSMLGGKRVKLRRMQQDWKDRLRRHVRETSLLDVSVRLLDLGSQKANESNVRNWMSRRSIHPNDRADFDAIMRLVGLDVEKDIYWRAMKTIDLAHLQAGQVIRRALLAQVERVDLSVLERLGSMEFDVAGGATGRMIASRVMKVGHEIVEISSSRIGKPIDVGGG